VANATRFATALVTLVEIGSALLKLCQSSRTVAAVILHALGIGAKIMQERFRMFRRSGGNFYTRDKITGRSESLGTSDRTQARQLLAARNQAAAQPQLNRTMAKAYLSAKSPDLLTRTWANVMEHYSVTGVESTRKRKATAFRSRPFAHLHGLSLMDTEAAHLLAVLEHERAGNSAHHYLRRLHNFALHLGWLLMPVMADAAWPEVRKRKFTAITEDEHRRVVDRERSMERKLYYEMLWETGGAQTDIASLHSDQVDLENETIRFRRRKLAGKESGGESILRIGPSLKRLLLQLPTEGYLFPNVNAWNSNTRSSEFCRRCRMLGIEGRSLHSYRYAWAQRARAAGMPEREAMNHLGHESRAIHAAYAGGATVATLPLEFYEAQKAKTVVQFTDAA
jgi:integrase